ncbi:MULTISPECIES: lipase family protein [unclassified Pseudomonas]|uniref:lipase family protein n=1 Tax=unclassified Pseudomonas TaxID=196821 RepID=UPI002AC89786|nr:MULTISPECIES: lipase family protein [unclassified Pseudomonas]MEB0043001.1 lipase family protein [Pseudomonas sp. MH10]MEB0123296.1 lipase family protein [Pseudomonas sp. CCI1.2]WPX65393.1 lipase family protein [Pseudomonas sp. MH10]
MMLALDYDPSQTALYHPEALPSLLGIVPARDDLTLAVEAARLAYLRFEDVHTGRPALATLLSVQGFAQPVIFRHPETDSEGFGALRRDGSALIALRGTQIDHIKNVISDAQVVRMAWPLGSGKVHSGLAKAALGLWPSVEKWLNETANQRTSLTITGHSLGAAIATLLAGPADADFLVALGSPRVGDRDFTEHVSANTRLRIARLVDCCDVVTELVPANLGFNHVHGLGYIDRYGVMQDDMSSALIHQDQQRARFDYLARYAGNAENVFLREWADHSPINYVRAFW